MTASGFKANEVVMFFMEGGRLVSPPDGELTDETLMMCTWGTIEAVEPELIRILTDDGVIKVPASESDKICFINTAPASLMSPSPAAITPDDLHDIRPVADA